MRWPAILRALAWALAVAGGLALLLALLQRRLLYFPARAPQDASERAAARLRLLPWRDGQGRFLGWRSAPPGGGRARLLVLHGNAGAALDRVYLREAFQDAWPGGLEVLLLEYPGYGPRPGSPSQDGLVRAAGEAVDALRSESPRPVLLLGESLGSAVAALAAAARPGAVDGLILVTPLASVPAVARRHYPLLPAWLVRDGFHADRALPSYRGPVAFLVAGRDEVVFPDLGRGLFEAQPGPKRLWLDPAATHDTIDYDPHRPCWAEMAGFLLTRP